jgi:hypothetical protein
VDRARRVYRLHLALALSAAGAVATALALAMPGISLSGSSSRQLLEACRSFVIPDLTPSAAVVLALGTVSFAALARGLRSAFRQLRASRRFLRGLGTLGWVRVSGIPAIAFDDPQPHAFCSGLVRARIYVSSGALNALGTQELGAVLAHEAHHACRRDPLRIFSAHVLSDALFFLPLLSRLSERYESLAELEADEAAVHATGDRRPLAAALVAFDEPGAHPVVGIAPERVDQLLGHRARWRLPVSFVAAALAVLAALVAVALRTADAGGQPVVSMPMVLAEACMVTMAATPLLIGAAGLLLAHRGSRRLGGLRSRLAWPR